MGFVTKTNDKTIRLTMTDYGMEKMLESGVFDTFTNFALTDTDIVYWLCVEPDKLVEVTGSHKEITDKTNIKFKYTI